MTGVVTVARASSACLWHASSSGGVGANDIAAPVSAIGCAQLAGRVGWSYADPHAVLLDDEEILRTLRRGGSIERRLQSARVTLENTHTATPSGVQPAVRKGSP
jgi:hypothetical protein